MFYEITKPRTVISFDVRIQNRSEFNSHLIHVARDIFPRRYKAAHVNSGKHFIGWARHNAPEKTGRLKAGIYDKVGDVAKYPYSFVLSDTRNPRDGFPYPWALNFAPEGRYMYQGRPTYWWWPKSMGQARPYIENEFRMVLEYTRMSWNSFTYNGR